MTGDIRDDRAAKNESLFRDHNESVEMDHAVYHGANPAEWICECADETCATSVQLTVVEYEAVRANAAHFLVAPNDDHTAASDIERVVKREERYWVVEKIGRAAEVSERFDPRSRQRS